MKADSSVEHPLRLIHGGRVYAPDDLGEQDLLIGGGKILAMGPNLSIDGGALVEETDASGLLVLPGFIDSHLHILGGGGQGGPETRNRDILLSSVTQAGVTTVIGMLGFDCVTRSIGELLAKARALSIEGITALINTGGYEVPTPTLLGSVREDIAFVEQIVGLGEIAISDHRSSHPTINDLAKLCAEAHIGGLVGKKSGNVVLHVGEGKRGLQPLLDLLEYADLPPSQFVATHVNRNPRLFAQAVTYARQSGIVDITAGISPELGFPNATAPSRAIKQLLDAGAPIERITASSDANGNMPVMNEAGEVIGLVVQQMSHLYDTVRKLVCVEGLPVELAIQPVTSTPARIYQLRGKGRLAPGTDADLLLVEPDLTLRSVYAHGRLMVHDGETIVKGTYEKDVSNLT